MVVLYCKTPSYKHTVHVYDGISTGGEDYENIMQLPIELVASMGGSRSPPMECVNISIISDSIVEDDEMFSLHLGTNDPDVLLSPVYANVTIQSDDSK